MSRSMAATGAAIAVQRSAVEKSTIRKLSWRLIPLVTGIYLAASLDRANVSFAALTMNKELGISALAYGWGAGIYFIGTFITGVPCNMICKRIGPRATLTWIAVLWGVVAAAQSVIRGSNSFLAMRLLLGIAEAGLFPIVVLYLSIWFPAGYRSRVMALFLLANPLSSAIGGVLAGPLLLMDGLGGLRGWQWMFLLEAVPPFLLAGIILRFLTNRPEEAGWLEPEERSWLASTLMSQRPPANPRRSNFWQTLFDPVVALFCTVYFGRMMSLFGVTFFLPLIVKGMGMTNSVTGYVSALPFTVAVIGMLVWAHYSDKSIDRRWHLLATHLVTAAGLALAAYCGTSLWAILALSVAAIGFSAQAGCFWSMPSMVLTPGAAPVGIALINSIGSLGAIFGPFAIGLIKDRLDSYDLGLYFLAVCVGGVGLLVLALPRAGRQQGGHMQDAKAAVGNAVMR
jgi:ACS family tartrate transporter-like MFS transporter